jgi:hypothetical protein
LLYKPCRPVSFLSYKAPEGYLFCNLVLMVNKEKSDESATADVTEANLESPDTSLTEKIIKTADMRFRVKDVQQTKERLSSAIKAEGGTVAEFSIQSNVQKTEKVRYSADSLLELTAYRTDGYITAKVPSDKLDEFTNKIAGMAVFIDQQSMKLDDQSIAYLANQLKNRNRVEAVAQLNKHASKKSNNVETSLSLKDDYVDKKIENLIIDNKVKFSNITLNFYQDNTVKRIVVENDNLSDYRPGFFKRLLLSIDSGWTIFKEFLLILTNLWVLFVLGILAYWIFKYYGRKKAAI